MGSGRAGNDDVTWHGEWATTEEYLAAGKGASLTLDDDAATVYLDFGGTDTVYSFTFG